MTFRFVHTADIHLDSPLKSLALRDTDLATLVETATRDAFRATIKLCLDEDVEALLIAGDLYDGSETSMKTAAFLAGELGRLAAAGVRVFIVRGNHDAASKITEQLDLPEAVHVFTGRAGVMTFESRDGDPVAVHGLSFAQPHISESLLPKYKPPVPGAINIALMHTSLEGAAGHDPYAPVSVADLAAAGFDYWALGHIHKRTVHGDGLGADRVIVMPGIPQGRHVNEAGPKSVTLATAGADGVMLAERSVAQAEFARINVDVTGAEGWAGVRRAIKAALVDARAEARPPHLIARLTLKGGAPFAWRLRRDADQLAEEAKAIARGLDGVWIESIEIEATAPPADMATSASPVPAAELAEHIQSALATPAFQADAMALAEALIASPIVPAELRDAFGRDDAERADLIQRLAAEGAADALARLTLAEDGTG